MASDRPAPPERPDLALADTLLADSSDSSRAPTVESDRADSSDAAFGLATGEPSLIPVTVEEIPPPSSDLPRYEEGALLGAGGMGEVRLLRDARIGRSVARKTLLEGSADAGTTRRFLREARVQGQLEHPAVVPVYDLDFDEAGRPFFTMKRVRGLTLGKIIDQLGRGNAEAQKKFGRRRLLSAFTQVCHAVHYAHVRGVVHRDLKPGNIMLGDYGEVYVLDWGVARLLRDTNVEPEQKLPISLDASTGLTRHGDLVGSVGYMAPEQMEGNPHAVDARADVFALGVVLFELLTLEKFREAASLPVVVKRVLAGEARKPSDLVPDVPPELDAITLRSTLRRKEDRFQTAGELAEALDRYLEGDRDREARRALARDHTRAARKRLETSGGDSQERIDAMRDVVRALALDPENADAQALLVHALVEVKGPAPAEAEAEFQAVVDRMRTRGARVGTLGYLVLLLAFPLAVWLGVRDWPVVIALTAVTSGAAAFSFYSGKRPTTAVHTYVLAVLTALMVTISSAILGPFVLVPALAATALMYFVVHVTPSERRISTALITLGALLPFAIESLGLFPPAYSFEAGRIVLFARAVELPKLGTLFSLVYVSISFVALPAFFTGGMRDDLMAAQRRLVIQAWQLRQMFPARPTTSLVPPPDNAR